MASGYWLTAAGKVSHERHKSYWPEFVLRHQAVLQERGEAICLSGIHRRRCNVSSRQRATKSSLRSSSKPNMTMQSLRCGISRQPFSLNTKIDATASSDRSTRLTTLFLALGNAGGSSVNPHKS